MKNPSAWPLPPVAQIRDFLPQDEHSALLEWVLGNEPLFRPAKLAQGVLAPDVRISLTTRKFGQLAERLKERMLDVLPSLEAEIGKVDATSAELELAAHGDGAFYAQHVDMRYGEGRDLGRGEFGEDRVLSAVYYFHREPKHFSGGALRLYRFNIRPGSEPASPDDYVDIEPLQNSLVAFAPWATHEVRPVVCPSNAFADYRFALNCWFCRKL